jgi:arginine decarboxylase
MVQHGEELLGGALDLTRRVRSDIEQIAGFHVLEKELLGAEASRELDPMHVIIDVTNLGISGYQAADWLRAHPKLDMGLSDSKRIEATMSMVDDDEAAPDMPSTPPVQLPGPGDLDAETAMLPRDAFFGPVEVVPVAEAAGRISAELITPYPPGIPAIFPGERINAAVLDYLTSGVAAGMVLPDPGDASLQTVRVVPMTIPPWRGQRWPSRPLDVR